MKVKKIIVSRYVHSVPAFIPNALMVVAKMEHSVRKDLELVSRIPIHNNAEVIASNVITMVVVISNRVKVISNRVSHKDIVSVMAMTEVISNHAREDISKCVKVISSVTMATTAKAITTIRVIRIVIILVRAISSRTIAYSIPPVTILMQSTLSRSA